MACEYDKGRHRTITSLVKVNHIATVVLMPQLQKAQKLAEVIDTPLARALEMSGDAAVRWPQFARVLVWQMWHLLTGRACRTQA